MEPGDYEVMSSRPGEAEPEFIQRVVLERLAGWDVVDSFTEDGVALVILRYDPADEAAAAEGGAA